MHIAIAGNIGSGKTTLTTVLAKRYNWIPQFEPAGNNLYLDDFYADMTQWSLNLQIYFLNKRLRDVVAISKNHDIIIQDRTIFEGTCIFAPNLHSMGTMSDHDFDDCTDLFDLMMSFVKLPGLLVYTRSGIPNLVSYIQKRDRESEKPIRTGYLQGLNTFYEGWISTYKGNLMIIGDDRLHFEKNP